MVDVNFPLEKPEFLFKVIAWFIDIGIIILWTILPFHDLPLVYSFEHILFAHAVAGYMVVLSAFMIIYIFFGEDEEPTPFVQYLFGIPGCILFLLTGFLTFYNQIKLSYPFYSYIVAGLCMTNGVIFLLDLVLYFFLAD